MASPTPSERHGTLRPPSSDVTADHGKPGGQGLKARDDHLQRLTLPFQPCHGLDEVPAGGAVDPCRPDDVVLDKRAPDHLLAGELAPHKLPELLYVLDEIPRTAIGKVDVRALRERIGRIDREGVGSPTT